MRVAVLLPILAILLLTAVWIALFVAPSLQGQRWSVVLLVDDREPAPGPVFEEWAHSVRRFARRNPGAEAVALEPAVDADLARAGYLVADDVADPIAWLDARVRDGQPFFLALYAGRGSDIAFERISSHLERTGLARRTILAAWTATFFAFDMPSSLDRARAVATRDQPSDPADILPTLLQLIGLTPSRPLPGYALAG
jgi:hypothetical protein